MSNDKYFGDVVYEVWRSGGNVDAIDPDRMDDARWNGVEADDFAASEVGRQHRREVGRDMREWEANEWDAPDNERFSR